jgi:lysozyme
MSKLLKHITLREGFRDHVYKDSLGFPTGGIGHRLTDAENKLYPVGDSLPKALTDKWISEDIYLAEQSAIEQSSQVPDSTPAFQDALTSVNFQMGCSWTDKFPTAWRHMKAGCYDRAISEIKYTKEGSGVPSLWARQTPIRVRDFVSALTILNEES